MTPRPPATGPTKTLVISDGSLGALLATAIVSEQAAAGARAPSTELGGIVWGVPASLTSPGPCWDACDRAAGRQADIYGLGYLPPDNAFRTRLEAIAALPAGGPESLLLVEAVYTAALHECPLVVWPVQAPSEGPAGEPDLDAVARSVDRAILASRLAGLDTDRPAWPSGVPEVRVDTPFVDLRDAEIADLARDMRVPLEACWWADRTTPGASAERDRWSALIGAPRAGQTAEPKPAPSPQVTAETASRR